jgi:hypothetical protein
MCSYSAALSAPRICEWLRISFFLVRIPVGAPVRDSMSTMMPACRRLRQGESLGTAGWSPPSEAR